MASAIVDHLSKEKLTVPVLLQADSLLRFLDSSVFMHIRLHLVNPSYMNYQALVYSVYTFSMMLPQSEANAKIQARLQDFESLYVVLRNSKQERVLSEEDQKRIQLYHFKQTCKS